MLAGGGGFFRYGVVRESTINRLPGPQTCRNYTATATLWKVDMTVSNVWTRGVPSITFAKVFNTCG